MIRYFDASALVKRYVREAGSSVVRRLLQESAAAASRLSEVEIASALARRCREGALTVSARDRALAALRSDFLSLYVVELSAEICNATYDLLLRHRLRASDAIQLASCIQLQKHVGAPVRFIVYEARLTDAARGEGLTL